MLRLLCVSLFPVTMLLACSGSEATPAPTDAPAPTPTQEPAAEPTRVPTAEPTVAPTPAPTPPADEGARAPAPASAVLAPLDVTDSEAFLSGLSGAEQACVSENIDPDLIMLAVVAPDLAQDEEAAALVGCLEEEALLRLYLTPALGQAGPLSAESSACIRSSFAEVDLSEVMTTSVSAGPGQDSEAAMVAMMAGFFATLSCLNEEEFQAAAPALGMVPEDQAGLQCLMDQLGGPQGLAALMGPEEGPHVEMLTAAVACNLQMSGGP